MLNAQQKVTSNLRQQSRLAYKRREVLKLANAIDDEVRSFDIKLPRTFTDYQDNKEKILREAGYDITNEFVSRWDDHFNEIIKLQYTLRRTNKAVYALFENGNKIVKPMLVSMWYTKHRMDEVWLMRKSQLIRSIYKEYLQTATLPNGRLLIKTYTPAHLVLTIPHNAEGYNGKKFYLKELLSLFHELRRCKEWKKNVYGGEYGAEVKKSNNGNGLHIHIHSLIFLNNSTTINEFRKWIAKRWADITGNTNRAFIHLEQLFTYKRDDKGNWITQPGKKRNMITGEYEDLYDITFDADDTAIVTPKMVRKKHYVGTESNIEDYLQGVMECIKYHFKSDTYKNDDGSFDIPLIRDILNHSRNVRFYSRYGAFYKCKELNFDNRNDDKIPDLPIKEDDIYFDDRVVQLDVFEQDEAPAENKGDDIRGSAARGVRELINPFTFEPATENDYTFAVASPEDLKYASGKDINPYHLQLYGTKEFKRVAKGVEIGQLVRGMVLGQLQPMLIKQPERVAWYDKRTLLKEG